MDRTRPAPVRLPHPSGRIGQPSPARTGLAVPAQRLPARPATADDAKPSHAAKSDHDTTVRSGDKDLLYQTVRGTRPEPGAPSCCGSAGRHESRLVSGWRSHRRERPRGSCRTSAPLSPRGVIIVTYGASSVV